ncbi:MAG: Uma2 family endonuclease [Planctomycetaceae bacterium]|nr:Uma2 family endonuclease [Planctomycetaceae bacterium]
MPDSLLEEFSTIKSATLEPLTVQQYHAMIKQGILEEGVPIELIDGLLIRKDRRDQGGDIMTVGPRHANIVKRIHRLLADSVAGYRCHVQSQQPVTLNGIQEPEPDAAIVLGHEDDYDDHHPGPGAIPLVIEVADSSLETDRGRKQQNYAVAGIPHYWLVNLRDNTIEHYVNPQPHFEKYEYHTTHRAGETVSFEALGQTFELSVDDILK